MSRLPSLLLACVLPLASAPPEVVREVDLARYMGTWYEVARLPNPFQKGCACTWVHYELRPDGKVAVLNRCRTPEGRLKEARGTAWVADPVTRAKLKVRFFWPFKGDYWILSRAPRLPEAMVQALLARARAQGFDTTRLLRTPPCGPEELP